MIATPVKKNLSEFKEALLLRHWADFERVASIRPDLLQNRLTITGTIDAYLKLQQSGVECIPLVCFVQDSDGEIYEAAVKEANQQGILFYEAFENSLYRKSIVKACESIEKEINEKALSLKKIWFFETNENHELGQGLYFFKNNLLGEVFCEAFKSQPVKMQPILPYPIYDIRRIWLKFKQCFKRMKKIQVKTSHQLQQESNHLKSSETDYNHHCSVETKSPILLFGSLSNLRYMANFKTFYSNEILTGVYYGHVNFDKNNRLGTDIFFKYDSLNNFKHISNGKEKYSEILSDILPQKPAKCFPQAFLEKVKKEIQQINAMIKKLQPRLMFVSNNGYLEKALICICKKQKIPVFMFQHGFVDSPLYLHSEADYLATWGSITSQIAKKLTKMPENRIIQLGNPGLQSFKKLPGNPKCNQFQILILTAGFDSVYPTCNPFLLKEAWDSVIAISEKMEKTSIVIRSHPYSDFWGFYQMISKLPNFSLSRGRTLEEDFLQSHLIIQFQIPSTAGLAAMATMIPFLFHCSALGHTHRHPGSWKNDSNVLCIQKNEDLIDKITSIRNDDDYRNTIIKNQHRFFEENCSSEFEKLSISGLECIQRNG